MTCPGTQILAVPLSHPGQVPLEQWAGRAREDGDAVSVPFSSPQANLPPLKVHVLHSQIEALEQPQAGAVEQQ